LSPFFFQSHTFAKFYHPNTTRRGTKGDERKRKKKKEYEREKRRRRKTKKQKARHRKAKKSHFL